MNRLSIDAWLTELDALTDHAYHGPWNQLTHRLPRRRLSWIVGDKYAEHLTCRYRLSGLGYLHFDDTRFAVEVPDAIGSVALIDTVRHVWKVDDFCFRMAQEGPFTRVDRRRQKSPRAVLAANPTPTALTAANLTKSY